MPTATSLRQQYPHAPPDNNDDGICPPHLFTWVGKLIKVGKLLNLVRRLQLGINSNARTQKRKAAPPAPAPAPAPTKKPRTTKSP